MIGWHDVGFADSSVQGAESGPVPFWAAAKMSAAFGVDRPRPICSSQPPPTCPVMITTRPPARRRPGKLIVHARNEAVFCLAADRVEVALGTSHPQHEPEPKHELRLCH